MHAEQLRISMQKAHSAFDAYKKKRNKRSRLKLKRARAEWKTAMKDARSAWVLSKCQVMIDEHHHHQFYTAKDALESD